MKRYPYILDEFGKLNKVSEREAHNADRKNLFYLTDEKYEILKNVNDALSEKIRLMEKQKQLELTRMRLIINEIKKR